MLTSTSTETFHISLKSISISDSITSSVFNYFIGIAIPLRDLKLYLYPPNHSFPLGDVSVISTIRLSISSFLSSFTLRKISMSYKDWKRKDVMCQWFSNYVPRSRSKTLNGRCKNWLKYRETKRPRKVSVFDHCRMWMS